MSTVRPLLDWIRRPSLGELLLKLGMVTEAQLQSALHQQTTGKDKVRLGTVLTQKKNRGAARDAVDAPVTEYQLAQALAEQAGLTYLDLANTPLDFQWLRQFPLALLQRTRSLPFRTAHGDVVVLVDDPTVVETLELWAERFGKWVDIQVVAPSALRNALGRLATVSQELEQVAEAVAVHLVEVSADVTPELAVEELEGTEEQPVVRFVHLLIAQAIRRRASDIHIEVNDQHLAFKYRIDGVLQPALAPIEARFHPRVISRIKIMAELNIAEKRVPQDGRFQIRFEGRTIDFRVSILPTLYGEVSVIRILDKQAVKLDLGALGMDPQERHQLLTLAKYPHGMVLVTGPTGSGKTTTLYALLNMIRTGSEKLLTIEDPIEYLIPDVVQVPVNEKKGLTFAKGLRSLLRHDPDKILVGEIRDAETAQIAVQAALTGHLVFSTIHANNVVDVIGRLINMGIEPYEFVSALNGILAQRLVRILCPACRVPKVVSSVVLGGLDVVSLRSSMRYSARGCHQCGGTGYFGRTGVYELMRLSDRLKEMILAKASFLTIREQAKAEGLVELRQAALNKLEQGITSLEEVDRIMFTQEGSVGESVP